MEKGNRKLPNNTFFIFTKQILSKTNIKLDHAWFLLSTFASCLVFFKPVHINAMKVLGLSNCANPSFQIFMSNFQINVE